jgi:tRNA(fMet)-specific endonuclease VapC
VGVILDTSALSAFLAGDANLGRALAAATGLALPVIVLGEYRFGLLRSKKRAVIERALDALEASSEVLHVDARTARTYAQIRDRLKSAGTPIPSNDLWIASLAAQHALPLLSRDQHFDLVPNVRRVGW